VAAERLFPVAELTAGTMRLVWPAGRAILVVNAGGAIYAVDGVCTHEYCELDRGFLSPASVAAPTLTCPLHLSRFDLESGEALDPPAEVPLGVHRVSVDAEGWLLLHDD
jgi:nitrite reductase/ring-hydroxylating ferredoxin subunit